MCRFVLSSAHAVWQCHFAWHTPGTVTVHGPGDNPLIVRMPMAMGDADENNADNCKDGYPTCMLAPHLRCDCNPIIP